jgi:hypothetical protein
MLARNRTQPCHGDPNLILCRRLEADLKRRDVSGPERGFQIDGEGLQIGDR